MPGSSVPGDVHLTAALVNDLRRMNPWWEGNPLPVLPETRRHLVRQIQRRLDLRLAPAVVVRGPRQIGKTTAQLQVLQDLLDSGVPPRNLFRVQADELPELAALADSEPILRLIDWYERTILGKTLNEAAREGQPTYLFFDEVQNLRDWAPQLKSLVDSSTTQVLVTGSSALRIELGRDSLAGRITTIEAGVLSLTEIAAFRGIDLGPPFLEDNGLEPLTRKEFWDELVQHGKRRAEPRDLAFRFFSERGGYPLVHQRADVEWSYLVDQLNETVIRRVIQHDLRVGARSGQPEIDFVLTIGTKRIPLEIKYQKRIDPLRDTEGLRTFLEKSVNNAPFGILVTLTDTEEVVDPRIVTLPLSTLMLLR
jgi:predicted AAA+ superfamily ATPase